MSRPPARDPARRKRPAVPRRPARGVDRQANGSRPDRAGRQARSSRQARAGPQAARLNPGGYGGSRVQAQQAFGQPAGRHVGGAGQRDHRVRPAGGQQRGRQAHVCAATTLSSTRPCTSSIGRASSGRTSGSAAELDQRVVRVDVAAVGRQAQVPLGVGGVVERPVGDRGAGDRAAVDVRAAQHRQRRPASRRTTSRGSPPGSGPGRGACPASACSASTWSVRITSANRRWIAFSKRRRHAGRAPVVDR